MKISLENAVKAASEYLAEEFSKMPPNLGNAGMHIFAEYKLATQGPKVFSALDDGSGKINIDVLEGLVNKYSASLPDQTFKTPLGEIKIKSDTPAQLMEFMKKYGEN